MLHFSWGALLNHRLAEKRESLDLGITKLTYMLPKFLSTITTKFSFWVSVLKLSVKTTAYMRGMSAAYIQLPCSFLKP